MSTFRRMAAGAFPRGPFGSRRRRYQSGVRPLEDRVTLSATPWSQLDPDDVAGLLAGTTYVQNEIVVALKDGATTFADVLAIESARDAVTTSAVAGHQALGAVGGSALYQLTLDAAADFSDTLAAISNWTSVEWAAPNFIHGDAAAGASDDVGVLESPIDLTQLGPDHALTLGGLRSGSIATVGEIDTYTFDLLADQSLSLVVYSTSIRTKLRVTGPGDTDVSVIAPVAGNSAILQSIPITSPGLYTITVESAAGTGTYVIRAAVNAAIEVEPYGGGSNNTRATAQDLNGAWINTPVVGLDRLVVQGGNTPQVNHVAETGFETGALPAGWTTYSSHVDGQIYVSGIEKAAGNYALHMDRQFGLGGSNSNEADWTVDLSGRTNVNLTFSNASWFDELLSLPKDFFGHANGDGISFSVDGTYWIRIWDPPANRPYNTWQSYTVSLSDAAAAAGVTLGAQTRIRFQQYGFEEYPWDGQSWDEISLDADPISGVDDWYKVSLDAGATYSAAVYSTSRFARFELYDAAGSLLSVAKGDGIRNFAPPVAGDYYFRVTDGSGLPYQLVLFQNTQIDTADNDSLATADRVPYGFIVGSATSTDPDDFYRVRLQAGDIFTALSTTPAAGLVGAVNTFDPALDLYDSDGTLVASMDDVGADPNPFLSYSVSTTGTYTLRVRATESTTGAYVVKLEGVVSSGDPSHVVAASPTAGSLVGRPLDSLTLTFRDAILLTSLAASDLTVNGVAASGVTVVSGDTVRFTFTPPAEGPVNFAIAAGALVDVEGGAVNAWNQSVTYRINQPPVLNAAQPLLFSDIFEDPLVNNGMLVADLLATGAGGDPISDLDPGAVEGIAVIGESVVGASTGLTTLPTPPGGTWQYSIDGGAVWQALGPVYHTHARLLAADGLTRVRFVPDANFNGSATLTLRAWDRSDGVNGGRADTLIPDGSPFSSATVVANLTVKPVNDAPTLTIGPNVTVAADGAARNVFWSGAHGSVGPYEEVYKQSGSFIFTTDSPGLFDVPPSIISGWLSFTPKAGVTGTAVVSVQFRDNGGTADGGVDTSPIQTFTITTLPPPIISVIADQTISEGGAIGPISFSVIDADPPLTSFFVSVIDDPFSFLPLFAFQLNNLGGGNYELFATPSADQFGSGKVVITANDGVISTTRSFTLTINPVNDAPSFTKGADQSVLVGSGPRSVAGWATNIARGPSNESDQSLAFVVAADNPSLFSVQPAISSAGVLTYTPAAGIGGSTTVSVRLRDNGGTADGGVDESAVQTFTIHITAAPEIPLIADQNGLEDAPLVVDFKIIDLDTPPGSLAVSATSSNQTMLPDGGLSLLHLGGDDWRLTATPAADRNGSVTITIAAADGFFTVQRSFQATFASVNDVPSFTKGADLVYPVGTNTRSILNWATGISAGAFESQTLTFETSNDNNGLFSVQPAVDSGGNLSFTQAAGATGTAVVTIRIRDNGGTTNGGVDASEFQTFKITLTEPPVVAPIGDVTILEDGSAVVDVFVTDVDSLPAALAVSALAADSTLLPASAISAAYVSGNQWRLMLTPPADRFGSTTVTVTAAEGSATGSTTFQFNVTAVNDPPSFASAPPIYVTPADGPFVHYQWLKNISSGPNETGQNLTIDVDVDDPTLFAVSPTIDASGTLRFTGAGLVGVARITVRILDDGGTAFGGVDTSPPQTFEIHFTNNTVPSGILDPTFDADGIRTLPSGVGAQDLARDIARQTDGKYVVVGHTQTGTFTSPSAVLRYNADGTLDASFGTGGVVTLANTYNTQFFRLTAVEITSDGKILVAGDGVTGYYAARLNADGGLDTTFGTGGSAIFGGSFTTLSASPVGMALQADGKIVLTRLWRDSTTTSSNSRISVLRITASGAVDTTFGGSGTGFYLAPWSGSGSDVPHDVAVQADGKIVVVGTQASTGGGDFLVLRLTSSGDPDIFFNPFGTAGKVIVNVGTSPTSNDIAYRVRVQSDGKIVIGGSAGADFGLVRLNTDGSLDASFDTDGKVVTSIGATDQGFALAIQSDGRIIVGGSVSGNGNDFALARYTTSGALDTTFDGGGKKIQAFGAGSDQIYGLLVESDGKIVAAGVASNTLGGNDFALARFGADGALDTSLGGGVVTKNFGPGSINHSRSITLPDGRILIAAMLGENASVASGRYGVWRLLADGSLDLSFDSDGVHIGTLTGWATAGFARQSDGSLLLLDSSGNRIIRLTADGAVDTSFGTDGVVSFGSTLFSGETGLAVQADDSILVIGYKNNTATTFDELAVARFTAEGVLDTSFDGDGQVLVDVGVNSDRAAAIALQGDGKLVVVGTASNGADDDFAIVRLNADGSLDTTFSDDGKIVEAPGGATDRPRSVLIQADGKIVVAGTAASDFAVVRYTTGGTLDATFAGDGSFNRHVSGTDEAYAIIEQADGKLLVVGHTSAVSTATNLAAFRLSVDGTLDTTFDGGDGIVSYPIGSTSAAIVASAALQPDGKLLAVGVKNQAGRYDAMVLRYLTRPIAIGAPAVPAVAGDQTVAEEGTISFTVTLTDQDTPVDWLQLSATTSNSSLFTAENMTFTSLGGGQWSVSITPRADQFGTNVVTLAAWDGMSFGRSSFNVVVTPINDAPAFVKGADVFAGAGVDRSIAGWATSISAGNPPEFGQNLAFEVTAADPSLFDVLPAIDASGRLTFKAKSTAAGQSTSVTVRLVDDGGTAAGGVDTSTSQTFNITIGNAPSFTSIADPSILEGGQAVVTFSVSDLDTPLASIGVTAASGDTQILPGGGVSLTNLGSGDWRLTLTPSADRYGTVVVTLTASDGVYASTHTLTLDVANVNDAPSFVVGPDQFVDAGAGPQTVLYWAKSVSNGALETAQQRTFLVAVDDPSLFAVLPTIAADGTLSYAAAAGKSGMATVTVTLQDDGGTAGGGVDVSPPQTFKIRVLTGSSVAGDFDPTFDVDGIAAVTSPRVAMEPGRDVIVQADGKIVVAAIATMGPAALTEVVVRRFLSDGILDTSFGDGGVARFGDGASGAAALELAPDGKIYVAFAASSDFCVARLLADGSLDPSYGTAGVARAAAPSTTEAGAGMALQLDGRVVVVGSIQSDLGAVRFNVDGSLDLSFGVGGFFRHTISSTSNDVLNDVVVQNDGRIVAAGFGTLPSSATGTDWVVVRLTAAGLLDQTFSGDGILTATNSTGSASDQAFRVAVDGLDRIVVGGNFGGDFGLLRLNPDGSFDTSFSGDGLSAANMTSGTDTVTGLLLQSDGAITAIGNTSSTTAPGMQIARFLADGSLDLAFDEDGRKSIRLGDAGDVVHAAALQADGRIVAAGQAMIGPDAALALVRLTPAGTLDDDFAGDGIVLHLGGRSSVQIQSIVRQPGGGYVVGGFFYTAGTSITARFFVSRYTAAGALDTSFGAGGYAFHPTSTSGTPGLAVQSDGKIVAIGRNSSTIGVVRFNVDGAVDPTFGTAGVAALPASFTALEVAVQSDGKVLIGGRQSSNVALARYNADGTLDTTFSADGVMNFDAGGTSETVEKILQQADGKILVGGTASNGTNNDLYVARLNVDGTLDASFDGDGYVPTPVGTGPDTVGGMVLQADGKIVLGGATSEVASMLGADWALVRYNTDGTLDTTFDGDGIVTFVTDGAADTFGDLQIQADGRLVAVGAARNGPASDMIVARFLPGGGLDPTFAEDGVFFATFSPVADVAHAAVIDPDGKIVVVGNADVDRRFEGRIFRLLNDVDQAPTVAGVYVRGSAWSSAFLDHLDAGGLGAADAARLGYSLSGGATQTTVTVPWSNVDRITVRFDRDVVATLGSLTLYDSSGQGVAALAFRYLDGRTVEWTVPVLNTNKYLIHLDAAMVGGIADLALDGEWTTDSTTWGTGSGNGAAGGSFNFRFNVLPGDFDSSGSVAFGEIGQARLKLGLNTSSAGYLYRQDYDGSGSMTFGEIGQARGRLGSGLSGLDEPPPPPEAFAGGEESEQDVFAESFGIEPEFAAAGEEPASTFDLELSTEDSLFVFDSVPDAADFVPPEYAESDGKAVDSVADAGDSFASFAFVSGPIFPSAAPVVARVRLEPAQSGSAGVIASTALRMSTFGLPFARFDRGSADARFDRWSTARPYSVRSAANLSLSDPARTAAAFAIGDERLPVIPTRSDGADELPKPWTRLRKRAAPPGEALDATRLDAPRTSE